MTVTVKNIIPRKQAENSQTTQYTALNVKTVIDKFTVTNTSAVTVSFSCNLVAMADTPGNQNLVTKTRGIAAGEAYTCPELVGQVLDSGGYISTLASAAASLTISASGREIT
ncbi:hypothetical protein [Pseudomonas chlororaphis]|uniref:hypothetical protein n=1 Tax=Pseudomonas chlororaphis TaxID=587753 RepID=UPI000BE44E68|nr:hypothetical protein [Pseudomonas chlororaphis]